MLHWLVFNAAHISIHAPRTGSDMCWITSKKSGYSFQSTLPARGATSALGYQRYEYGISIHAPRTGSDDLMGR